MDDTIQTLRRAILKSYTDLAYVCHRELINTYSEKAVAFDLREVVLDVGYNLLPLLDSPEANRMDYQWKLICATMRQEISRDVFVLYEMSHLDWGHPLIRSANKLRVANTEKAVLMLKKARGKAARSETEQEARALDCIFRNLTRTSLFQYKLKEMLAALLIIKQGLSGIDTNMDGMVQSGGPIRAIPWWAYSAESVVAERIIAEVAEKTQVQPSEIQVMWRAFGNEAPVGGYCNTSELWALYLEYLEITPEMRRQWPKCRGEIRKCLRKTGKENLL